MYVSGGPSVLPFFADFRAPPQPPPQKNPDCRLVILLMNHLTFLRYYMCTSIISGKDHFRPEICQVKTSGKVYEIKSSQV